MPATRLATNPARFERTSTIATGVLGLVLLAVAPTSASDAPSQDPPQTAPTAREARSGALPGAAPFAPELRAKLARRLEDLGAGYEPRTHHLLEDGRPRYSNRLLLESSPYLLQHAHNPVDWYPWGDEAFAIAKRLGRPILLSVGYSTCHWCHVMERESFEDEEIARVLNERYVAIKVDREVRPDVDSVYMAAVQQMTGRGGWPMTVWLDPDRRPFFGGTYFPARDGDRGARTGFLTLLRRLADRYDADPEGARRFGEQVAATLERALGATAPADVDTARALDTGIRRFRDHYDETHGGMPRAPKFPSSFPLRALLRYGARHDDERATEAAAHTLERMAAGGIHDQIGGGFHRYSVDARWLVPHFEKMLYDNARLALVYVEAWQATGDERFAEVARSTLDYLAREMSAPEGGFYSATDADSATPEGHTEEGRFFTWTPSELRAVVGPEAAPLVEARFGVTEAGHLEGRSVLHLAADIPSLATRFERDESDVRATLDRAAHAMFRARATRPAPLLDDKILVAWNGLAISAFARAGTALAEPEFVRRAEDAAAFVARSMLRDGRLARSFRAGVAEGVGFLDDHAAFIEASLDLYEATSDPKHLDRAIELQATLDRAYASPTGGYYLTPSDHETLIARERPGYDGAEPSGNSIAYRNLLRLYALTSDERYRSTATDLVRAFGATLDRSPAALMEMWVGLDFADAPREIVIVTPKGRRDEAEPFLERLRPRLLPSRVVIVAAQGDDVKRQSRRAPILEGKVARRGRTTAYVCAGGVCRLPASDPDAFAARLDASPDAPEPSENPDRP